MNDRHFVAACPTCGTQHVIAKIKSPEEIYPCGFGCGATICISCYVNHGKMHSETHDAEAYRAYCKRYDLGVHGVADNITPSEGVDPGSSPGGRSKRKRKRDKGKKRKHG